MHVNTKPKRPARRDCPIGRRIREYSENRERNVHCKIGFGVVWFKRLRVFVALCMNLFFCAQTLGTFRRQGGRYCRKPNAYHTHTHRNLCSEQETSDTSGKWFRVHLFHLYLRNPNIPINNSFLSLSPFTPHFTHHPHQFCVCTCPSPPM